MARSTKRKRDSSSADGQHVHREHEATPDSTATAGSVGVDQSPFTITWVKDGAAPNKRTKSTSIHADVSDVKEEDGIPGAGLGGLYTVSPGSHWNGLRKYRNFVVNPHNEPKDDDRHKFEVGQFVFVNYSVTPNNIVRDDKESWVAQVCEVRAEGQHAVYVRVMWFYWPEELPNNREDYHGEREIVASNFHQIIDAMTVSGKAQVYHLKDVHDLSSIPPDSLYWRQTIDIRRQTRMQLSPLPKECICKTVSSPDRVDAQCLNDNCGQWQHESCLVEAALKKYWSERGSKFIAVADGESTLNAQATNDEDGSEAEDTIVTVARSNLSSITSKLGRVLVDTLTGGTSQTNNNNIKKGKKYFPKKGKNKQRHPLEAIRNAKPWQGKLTAKLQFEKNAEGIPEFIGKATIYRLSLGKGDTIVEDFDEIEIACLFCGQSMVEGDNPAEEIASLDRTIDPSLFMPQASLHSPTSQNAKKLEYDAVREAAAENAASGDELSWDGVTAKHFLLRELDKNPNEDGLQADQVESD